MNTYYCTWRAMKTYVDATTTFGAQQAAIPIFQSQTRAKVKGSEVRVWLATKDGVPVVHAADF